MTVTAAIGRVLAIGALLGAFVFAVVFLIRGSDGGTYEVTGIFESVNGLVETAEVKAGGFTIGRVKEIDLPRGGYPHVTLTIDEGYAIRKGAIADLRLASQAGQLNRYIAITQGEGAALEDGSTLGLARTDQPVEFDQVVSFLTPRVREQVREVVAGVDRTTRGHGPDLARTLRHSEEALAETASLLREVSEDGNALSTLVEQGSAVIATVAQEPAEVQGTVDSLASVLDTTAARQTELTQSLELLAPGLRSPRLALDQLNRSTPGLRRVIHEAGPVMEQAVPLARDLRPTLKAARPALSRGRKLTAELPEELRAAESLLAAGQPLVDDLEPAIKGLNPFLDHLRARAPDSLGWLQLLGDAVANYDVNGHAGRIMVIFGNPGNKLIGPSDSGSGLLRRPFDRTPGVLESEPWEDYEDTFVGGAKPVGSFMTPAELKRRTP